LSNNFPLFLDTSFVYALTNKRDQWHERALKWQVRLGESNTPLLTTQFILIEIADGLASINFRQKASQILRNFVQNPLIEVVPFSNELYNATLDFYEKRNDKSWGFTDCSSFVVMTEKGLTDALTVDDDFRQAGFRALLIDDDF